MSAPIKCGPLPKVRKRRAASDAKSSDPRVVSVTMPDGTWTRDRLIAKIAVDGTLATAQTIQAFAHGHLGEHGSAQQTVDSLRALITASQQGSTRIADELLISQSTVLNTVFTELLRRALANGGSNFEAMERYMRLAFKAQSQCRATLESLARIKNPPSVAFVRQANIANGPQQVNNGMPPSHTRTEESESAPIELLENDNGEWMDSRATGTASRGNPAMATVGEIDRP